MMCAIHMIYLLEYFIQIVLVYIHFAKSIQHIQSRYGSHTVPQWGSDERLFAMRTQVPSATLSVFSWACLGRWYVVFEFPFNVLL